jgi:hypothetical protein
MAQVLAQAVNGLTPGSQVPTDDGDLVAQARAMLEKMHPGS